MFIFVRFHSMVFPTNHKKGSILSFPLCVASYEKTMERQENQLDKPFCNNYIHPSQITWYV